MAEISGNANNCIWEAVQRNVRLAVAVRVLKTDYQALDTVCVQSHLINCSYCSMSHYKKTDANNGGHCQTAIHLKDSQPQLFIYTFDFVRKSSLYAPNCYPRRSLLDTNVVVTPYIKVYPVKCLASSDTQR